MKKNFSEQHNTGVNNKKILVVDDDEGIRDIIKLALKNTNLCSVQTAENGKDAVCIIKQKTFDLIITDYNMPLMNGLELFEQCKAMKPEIPFIFVTGCPSGASIIGKVKKEGIVGCICKPFDLYEVVNMVTNALYRTSPALK